MALLLREESLSSERHKLTHPCETPVSCVYTTAVHRDAGRWQNSITLVWDATRTSPAIPSPLQGVHRFSFQFLTFWPDPVSEDNPFSWPLPGEQFSCEQQVGAPLFAPLASKLPQDWQSDCGTPACTGSLVTGAYVHFGSWHLHILVSHKLYTPGLIHTTNILFQPKQ